ncbi:MAG: ADP-dependent glucokinase [Methanosaeta sp. PtaB.Bin039]|nr:MAG: ADP-dependent glucokinase [Methanosaeta sp. PtaB.Bin039]OPY47533.1 MAG: ADP-dependent glucokinase [Methanosaeta sp. PtaU1.Bin028]
MGMKVICAYPVNLDAIHNLDQKKIEGRFLGQPRPGKLVRDMDDLYRTLIFHMREGSGSEMLIEDSDVARKIESAFSWQYRLGGNAGIMASYLAGLGAVPVLNAPALSARLATHLHPSVGIPIAGQLLTPLSAAGDREMVHFVLQFSQGQLASWPGGEATAPHSNRVIATFDPLNSRLTTTKDFDDYCLRHSDEIAGAIVSGFHLARGEDSHEIFRQKSAQVRSWKERNPGLFVHAEMGSFHKPGIMNHLLRVLPADSLGMNEDELTAATGAGSGFGDVKDALLQLQSELGISRVAVHTRDFMMSAVQDTIRPQSEVEALCLGADAAAALAHSGDAHALPPEDINPTGEEARMALCSQGAVGHGRGAYLKGRPSLCMAPSRLVRRPSFTVGLGDTATAACFYHELRSMGKA